MNETSFFLLQCIYLMLPGIMANSSPVLFKKSFQSLNVPVDFGKKMHGKEIFGSHKTYRGFAVGITSGAVVGLIQMSLYDFQFFRELSLYDYSSNAIIFGAVIGFGALFGDLVKSFFKRRFGIRPGEPWMPFDQIDAFIGGLAFMSIFYIPPIKVIFTLLALTIIFHLALNRIAYWLGIKDTKW